MRSASRGLQLKRNPAVSWRARHARSPWRERDTLRSDLGIAEHLKEFGVGTDRIDEMTAMALEDPTAGGNPVKMTPANTRALFEACIG